MDWQLALREQGDLAQRIADKTVMALEAPDLTEQQASQIYKLVVKGSNDFDQFVEKLEEADIDEDLYDALIEACDAIEDVWARLVVGVANWSRAKKGLPLVEFPDDDLDED